MPDDPSAVPFPDRAAAPTAAAAESAVGAARPHWRRLTAWFAATYGLAPEPVWWGRDGWALRYRRSGKTLTTLVPRAGGFTALVVIGPAVAPAVEALELSAPTRHAFVTATAYPDGRWLFLPVEDEATVDDVERLVACKSRPPRRVRRP
jgi:hypothetical protein